MNNLIKAEQELFRHESLVYERMRKIAPKLKTRVIEPIIRLWLVDQKTGQVRWRRERHSHSYTRNEYVRVTESITQQFEGTAYSDGSLAHKKTDASSHVFHVQDAAAEGGTRGFYKSSAATDDDGILAGRDATAESFDDYVLGNPITTGTGPNQLDYIGMTKAEGWNSGSSYYFSTFTRPLDNNTATPATVTVYEVALVYQSGGAAAILMARDIDAGGVAVPNGDRLYVEYEIRTSFP